jgi:23S rRNA (uracil1939-C5)-methyltransferase
MAAAPRIVIETSIAELAPGGEGVAHAEIDGERRAVFVRGVVQGDRVAVDVDASRRPARGHVLELLAAGPDRVAPACAFTARCGGCDWMQLSIAGQEREHVRQIRAALPEAWRPTPIAVHAGPEALGYRRRARLHARASGGRAIIGMNEARSHEPAEVDACVVLHPVLEAARARLEPLLEGAHGRGDAQVALGRVEEPRRAVLELRWSGPLPPAFFARLERAIAAGEWAGARVTCGEATRPAIVGDPTPWMTGADGEPLRLAPGGFGQPSDRANAMLGMRIAEIAHTSRAERAVELFAGSGNWTVQIARTLHDVTAVEANRDACDAARANLAARGLRARVVEGDASTYAWSSATRLLVLDPPRAGARAVAERVAKDPVRHLLYVSCDAPTLGRDLALLEPAGYAPRTIESFEMFPQTSHVETLVWLERAKRASGKSR